MRVIHLIFLQLFLGAVISAKIQAESVESPCNWKDSTDGSDLRVFHCFEFNQNTFASNYNSNNNHTEGKTNIRPKGIVHFENCIFTDLKLSRNWYNGTRSIRALRIEKSKIYTIEAGAFGTLPFKRMVELDLIDLPIFELPADVFDGLISLELLIMTKLYLQRFETNILLPFRKLNEIQLMNFPHSEIELIGLFGSNILKKTQRVRINGNNIGATISRFDFSGLVNVRDLNLRDNKITSIPKGVFEMITSELRLLDLSKNLLKTLPLGLFETIPQLDGRMIYLEENIWRCDCDLEHLRRLMQKSPKSFFPFVYCAGPSIFNGWRIIDIHGFCKRIVENQKPVGEIIKKNVFGLPNSATRSIFCPGIMFMFLIIIISKFFYNNIY